MKCGQESAGGVGCERKPDGDFGLGCAVLGLSSDDSLSEAVRFFAVGSETLRCTSINSPTCLPRLSALHASKYGGELPEVRRRVVWSTKVTPIDEALTFHLRRVDRLDRVD